MNDLFDKYVADGKLPLLVSFSNHMHELGFTVAVDFSFWDVYGYDESDLPRIAVLSVKNTVTRNQLEILARSKVPVKVVLVEGDLIDLPRFESIRVFLASIGVGLYIREVGWKVLPGNSRLEVPDDIVFRVAKRWWQDRDGNWVKACTKCGNILGTEGFYKRYAKNARDPYRNLCKPCFKGR